MGKVKHLGQITVQKTKAGNTLHIPKTMHSDGIERFVSSKKFRKIKGDNKELYKEGEMNILRPTAVNKVDVGARVWAQPLAGIYGKDWQLCVLLEGGKARVISTSQRFDTTPHTTVLVEQLVNYSFTIKTSPEKAITMATKKAAAKKVAAKATATKVPAKKAAKAKDEKGPGKIAQILELHRKGMENSDIVAKGFNKTTVSIQVSKYKKENAKPAKK